MAPVDISMSLKEELALISEGVKRALQSEDARRAITGWSRRFRIVVDRKRKYTVVVEEGEVRVEKGSSGRTDFEVFTTRETLEQILNGELSLIRAFMEKKVEIKGKISDEDVAKLYKLLSWAM